MSYRILSSKVAYRASRAFSWMVKVAVAVMVVLALVFWAWMVVSLVRIFI